MHRLPGWSAIAALILLAAGCGGHRTATAPDAGLESAALGVAPAFDEASAALDHAAGGFFPLQIGNRWQYRSRVELTVQPTDPAVPPTEYVAEDDLEGLMRCIEVRDGREYVVERMTYAESGSSFWIRFRQDRAGLYEWDDIGGPPACDALASPAAAMPALDPERAWSEAAARLGVPATSAPWRAAWESLERRRAAVAGMARSLGRQRPGGVLPGEIQRLRYPLYAGQSWVIRDDPSFTARVVGPVLLHTPAGRFRTWAIRINSVLFGPQDAVRVWYGRTGYLGLQAHLVGVATDPQGNPIGTMVAEQSETLTEIDLVRRHRVAAAPLGAPTAGASD